MEAMQQYLDHSPLLGAIENYWSRRADSYSEEVQFELSHENERQWMEVLEEQLVRAPGIKVLDIGTGPGFFAAGLARRGYQVTAVDYTPNMLEEAKKNAGKLREKITFLRMDAQNLDFPAESFDAIVTRNLTWNLEDPQRAYEEWHRVLKKDGVMLNFDAGWYNYLFDEEKAREFLDDRRNVQQAGGKDFEAYAESAYMEEISRKLILSRCKRPDTDMELLANAGFREVYADTDIGERVWDEREKLSHGSRKLFLLYARK